MTREEFMAKARAEIDDTLRSSANRLMNLVQQAWAEGKKNAEIDRVSEIIALAMNEADRRMAGRDSEGAKSDD